MAPKTRLDPLVKWKEREMEKARMSLALALNTVAEAKGRIEAAKERLASLSNEATSVDELALIERASSRARADIIAAEKSAVAASVALKAAQAAYDEASRKAETFRRANERQRAALVAEVERQERKTMDELANLLRERKS